MCYNQDMKVMRTKGTVYNLNYHLVWCPKYRRSVLIGLVPDRLQQVLSEVAAQHGFEILACEAMPDHVHIIASAPPRYSPADLAKLFKGVTSRRLRRELGGQVGRQVWKPGTLWSPSYYVGSAGNISGNVIKRYIEESQHL